MPIIASAFRPAWWLPGPHLQTLWPFVFKPPTPTDGETQRIETPDGDFIDLVWFGPQQGPVVLLLHGLEGGLKSHYILRSLAALKDAGYRACLMQFRGCSGEPNRLARSYHSGDSADFDFVLKQLESNGDAVFAAIGFSLGGNILLKWLGEQGDDSGLRCAMAVSVPFRLAEATDRMAQGLSRIYQKHLLNSLIAKSRGKFRRHPATTTTPLSTLRNFRLFDDQVTAPLHGFAGVDDYYQRASSRQFVPRIRTPTLLLHAQDDPFMQPGTPPRPEEIPAAVQLELTAQGGHVGFVTGNWPWNARCWFTQRFLDWLALHHNNDPG